MYDLNALGLGDYTGGGMPKKQPQKKKPWYTALISELGGAGGAATGAAIGSVVPGIGTIIGAGIGGFLGGTGGRVAENKVRDNRIGLGDALKEGLVSGVLSGAGEGYNAFKAAKGAKAGIEATQEAGKIAKVGGSLRSNVANPKVAASPFGASEEANIMKTLQEVGLKGSAKKQYQDLPNKMAQLNKQIGEKLTTSSATTTRPAVLDSIKQAITDSPQFLVGDEAYTKSLTKELSDLSKKFGGETLTAREIQAAKSDLSSKMGGIFNKVAKNADLNPKEASRLSIWEALDKHIQDIAPEVKSLTVQQSGLYKAAPGLLQSSKKSVGAPFIGIKSTTAERGLQAGQDLLGRGLQKIGGAGASSESGLLKGVAGAVGKQAKYQLPGMIGRAGGGMQQEPQPQSLDSALLSSQDPNMGMQMPQDQAQPDSNPYPKENLLYDIQRDPKHAKDYIAQYSQLQEIFGATAQKPLGATQQKDANNANSALSDINFLAQQLQNDPQSALKSKLPGGSLTQRITGTSQYAAATKNVADALGRMRSGGAINDEELRTFMGLLPASFDSPEDAQAKLRRLQSLFGSFASPQGGGSGMEDILMQAQQGAY